MNYLIHQVGKVASQTLHGTLLSVVGETCVERHHYLSDRGLAYLENMSRLPGIVGNGMGGVSYQLDLARALRTAMESWEPGTAWVLSGFRDPIAHAMPA